MPSTITLLLGNPKPKSGYRNDDDTITFTPLDGDRVTSVVFPEGTSLAEALATVTAANGVWANHSDGDATWVSCPESPGLEALLSEHFGCPIGAPDDVEDTHHTFNGPPGVDTSKENQA